MNVKIFPKNATTQDLVEHLIHQSSPRYFLAPNGELIVGYESDISTYGWGHDFRKYVISRMRRDGMSEEKIAGVLAQAEANRTKDFVVTCGCLVVFVVIGLILLSYLV